MVAYSSRLALTTTVTSLIFSELARDSVTVAVTVPVAVVLGTWSWLGLRRTAARWADPVVRAHVVSAVAL